MKHDKYTIAFYRRRDTKSTRERALRRMAYTLHERGITDPVEVDYIRVAGGHAAIWPAGGDHEGHEHVARFTVEPRPATEIPEPAQPA